MLPFGKTSVKKTKRKPPIHRIVSVAAPIGGINARDALAAMPQTDAYNLINWIPKRYGIQSRRGYAQWATGLGASVRTVMSYFSSATNIPSTSTFQVAPTTLPGKVFASTDASIFDVTSSGAVGAAVVTLSNTANAGNISSVNFTTSGGSFLLGCSETDGYYTYDGATWVKVILGAGATQVSVTDPTKFCQVAIWKRRAWFVTKSSSKVSYLPVDSIYGAGTFLDLGPLFKHGGSVAWISNWTIDAGEGIDDFLVIASENGDIVIYKGTDPASSTTFSLVGVWYAGEIPKGRKGFLAYGGDLLIVCNSGILPVSYITRGGTNTLSATADGNYTAKINQLFSNTIGTTFNFFGWELHNVLRESLIVVLVPNVLAGQDVQYVMNTDSNQWCVFNGMPMTCLETIAGWPLFGAANGQVYIAFTSFTDGDTLAGAAGTSIQGTIQPAFDYFSSDNSSISQNKHFLMAQPSFLAVNAPGVNVVMNTNFLAGNAAGTPTPGSSGGALLDIGIWDVATWGGGQNLYRRWMGADGIGYSGQLSLTTAVNSDTTLISIDYMFELGGPM